MPTAIILVLVVKAVNRCLGPVGHGTHVMPTAQRCYGGCMTPEQLYVLAIVVVAFGLLITERLRNDLVAVLIVVALYVSHVATAKEALEGFSSEPAIVVAAIF